MQKTSDEIKKGLECKKRVFADSCYDRCVTCELFIPCYGTGERCADALSLIQQLQYDNAKLNRCIENMTDKLNDMKDEAAKLQAERDAAVADIKQMVLDPYEPCFCDYCKLTEEECARSNCKGRSAFEWRGVQKEE